ncbi:MAG: hypothetical protein ACTSPW_15230 [Promethearchaeota archaeon]
MRTNFGKHMINLDIRPVPFGTQISGFFLIIVFIIAFATFIGGKGPRDLMLNLILAVRI